MIQNIVTSLLGGLIIPILLELWKEYRRKEALSDTQITTGSSVQQREPSDIQSLLFLGKVFYNFISISIGAIIVGAALKGFLIPNHFLAGGVTGLVLLVHNLYHVNAALLILLFNIPFIIFGGFKIRLKFALKTLTGIVILGLFLIYVPMPAVTNDKLLISIFGGFFLGIGFGICIRSGCCLDGIDVISFIEWKYIGLIGRMVNLFIFFMTAFLFGIESAFYSILAYYIADRTTDSYIASTFRVGNRRMKWLK